MNKYIHKPDNLKEIFNLRETLDLTDKILDYIKRSNPDNYLKDPDFFMYNRHKEQIKHEIEEITRIFGNN
ncbi:MAG: hypothetical protein ACXAC7_13565 [Candidatus Hodarchaeales archaeon]|jgi:hypothetical protein